MSGERITFDGDRHHLDEIVLTGATVHVERMSTHDWTLIIDAPTGRIQLDVRDLLITERIGLDDLITIDPPLLGCAVEWAVDYTHHRCDRTDGIPHRVHVCECGARQ